MIEYTPFYRRQDDDGLYVEVMPLTFNRARIIVTDLTIVLDGW